MDRHELDALLDAIADAAERADAVMRMIPRAPSRVEADYVVREARGHLAGLRAILERAREGEEVRRRTLLKALPMLAVSPTALERIGSAHRVDRPLIDAYQEALNLASQTYPAADKPALARVLSPHVERMADRLHAPTSETLHLRLLSLTAETAVLAGWTAMVAGQHARAREHFALAESAALGVDDPALRALALEGRSNLVSQVFSGGLGPSRAALAATAEAAESYPNGGCSVARRWVLARHAQELAASGSAEYARQLDAARKVEVRDNAAGLYRLDGFFGSGAQLLSIEAFGLTVTGQPGAERLLNSAMGEATLPGSRRGLLAQLANVHLAQNEPEQAARTSLAALDLGASHLTVQRASALYARMGQWTGVPAVRDLRERLVAAGA